GGGSAGGGSAGGGSAGGGSAGGGSAGGGSAGGGSAGGGSAGGGSAGGGTATGETCATAQDLILNGSSLNFQVNTTAAVNDSEGTCNKSAGGPELVFHLAVPQAKDVTITAARSAGAASNPVLYVRTAPCDTGVELGCSDNQSSSSATETVKLLNRSGDLYIFVETYGAASGLVDVSVTVGPPTLPPANDECGTAIPVSFTGTHATLTGDTTLATNSNVGTDTSPSCSSTAISSGRDVFYRVTLAANQGVQAVVTPTGASPAYDPVLAVRAPGQCSSGLSANELVCDSPTSATPALVRFVAPTAGDYFLVVDGFSSTAGPFQLDVDVFNVPANDSCAGAIPLTFTGNVATASGDLNNAFNSSTSGTSPTCSQTAEQDGADVVYRFTLGATQDVRVEVIPAPGSALVPAVYLRAFGNCANGLAANELACSTGGGSAVLTRSDLPAGEYALWVDDGYGNGGGAFTVNVITSAAPAAPANDVCAAAQGLTFSSGTVLVTGTTRSATNGNAASSIPTCSSGARSQGKDVSYSFSMPAGGPQTVSWVVMPTSSTHPVLYAEGACGAGPQLGCNAGSFAFSDTIGGATLTMTLDGGTAAFLHVDEDNAAEGSFTLFGRVGPPPNDSCASPRAIQLSTPSVDNSVIDSNALATDDYSKTSAPAYACTSSASNTGRDLVYSFTAPATARYVVTVTGIGSLDAVLAFLGTTCSPTTCTKAVDTAYTGEAETLTFDGVQGQTYYFVVDAYTSTSVGGFRLTVR
ncbi:MAG: hypothetical protein K1X89_19230, partial [Myxococcaceae bacterium]|nr:hypothetical protein [Myxococcaceae bacterium]